jgi:hypothetical protein
MQAGFSPLSERDEPACAFMAREIEGHLSLGTGHSAFRKGGDEKGAIDDGKPR